MNEIIKKKKFFKLWVNTSKDLNDFFKKSGIKKQIKKLNIKYITQIKMNDKDLEKLHLLLWEKSDNRSAFSWDWLGFAPVSDPSVKSGYFYITKKGEQ